MCKELLRSGAEEIRDGLLSRGARARELPLTRRFDRTDLCPQGWKLPSQRAWAALWTSCACGCAGTSAAVLSGCLSPWPAAARCRQQKQRSSGCTRPRRSRGELRHKFDRATPNCMPRWPVAQRMRCRGGEMTAHAAGGRRGLPTGQLPDSLSASGRLPHTSWKVRRAWCGTEQWDRGHGSLFGSRPWPTSSQAHPTRDVLLARVCRRLALVNESRVWTDRGCNLSNLVIKPTGQGVSSTGGGRGGGMEDEDFWGRDDDHPVNESKAILEREGAARQSQFHNVRDMA
eukprot:250502-Chlamydomonas_euryale.AAC.14